MDTLPRIPTEVRSFEVRCKIGQFVMDGSDPDRAPDLAALGGTVTISPGLQGPVRINGDDPLDTRVVSFNGLEFQIDPDTGRLIHPDGNPGVELVDPSDPHLDPQGWTYTATVRPSVGRMWQVAFGAPADGASIVNIGGLAGVEVSPGSGSNPVQQVVEARDETRVLATSAEDAAARAGDAATYAAEVAYGQPLEVTDAVVASIAADDAGALSRVLDSKYRRDIDPGEFGAVGDGIADDTAAVRAAALSGRPIHWGGPERVYRITEPITTNLTGPLVWRADGATIRGDFAQIVERMVTLNADGQHVTISGPLVIDAGNTAHVCLRVWNRGSFADLTATDLTLQNARRAVVSIPGGDGLQAAGAWSRISLIRPTVRNVTLAMGAEVWGSLGVTGISIYSINKPGGVGGSDTPHIVKIEDPYIDNIWSEDPELMMNQNGMRLFAGDSQEGQASPMLTHFTVTGGEVRDVRGRAVKVQAEQATVDGLRIIRTRGGQGITHDIDFQFGGGTVRNVEAIYEDGNVPNSVVNFSGNSNGKTLPQRQVSGLKVATTGDLPVDRLISVLSSAEPHTLTTISDVSAKGTPPRSFVLMSGDSGSVQDLVASNLVGSPSENLIRTGGGSPDGWNARVTVSSALNRGPVVPLVSDTLLARAEVEASGISGFTV